MTNKTLSEQICELCGIKPEIIQDYELNDIEVYPDFENNNNNFVELIHILHKNDFVISNEGYPSKENFVTCLLSGLLNAIDCEDRGWILKLKQAIRQADWEY